MAKIKVHELAKELGKQSKDILTFLQEKGIEAKAAQSSVEEDAAQIQKEKLIHPLIPARSRSKNCPYGSGGRRRNNTIQNKQRPP